jgi:putative MATE family efflux protein
VPRRPDRRTPHDREILRLALPAFGALAAEPLYVLADTAIVGHLGTRPLAGLAVAGVVLTSAYAVVNFLAYSTTAAVARRIGAGDRRAAAELGVDGMWLALGLGVALTVLGLVLAPTIVHAMGASSGVRPYALTYLRISLLGAPAMLVMLAGTGFLRGTQDTRTTLVVAVAANGLNLLLEVVLVYGLDTGIAGSAWGTVGAQLAGAAAYVIVISRLVRAEHVSAWPRREGVRQVAVIGGPLIVRTASLLAVTVATTSLAARIGDVAVAAHQIAYQVLLLLALSLDALAIAGQAMIGRFLGASDVAQARAAARRMIEWGVAVGVAFGVVLAAADTWLVRIFSDSAGVRHLAWQLLLIVAALQPLNAVVFVLDGVLIGAGDQRYLAGAMMVATFGVFAPGAWLVASQDAGLLALWAVVSVWFVARAIGVVARYLGSGWQVPGAARPSSARDDRHAAAHAPAPTREADAATGSSGESPSR